ncbi:uncharacterized protein TM35_000191720 [Trypanosoma theileri]|uniref:C3H1-type domain-containing protein n=1 Tax=Trypanosoma theileri TaxID=67003 RepID=A0A1X0NTQ7_9TRYP|nr:uncharacterized protein TM35_000191720 [Trypanosoma theileri]ORC87928.1 hypothetical protein TM35_000191720 [Trypanosoma theileri]
MGHIAPLIEPREGYVENADGVRCMVVVDPKTRKLLIPENYVLPTRAQQRTTIPSLCQLFVENRCRFGSQCHQVHADLTVVNELRNQVKSLPQCCTLHGDEDIGGVMQEGSWLSNVVVHIPESTYEGGYIPLSRVGYTVPLARMLNELPIEAFRPLNPYEQTSEDGRPPRVVLEADTIPICRLHSTSRCSYAEECNFLHLCKEVVEHDADLPLGRRSGCRATQRTRSFCVAEQSTTSHMLSSLSMSSSNIFGPSPHGRSTSVRGFPLVQRAGEGWRSPAGNSFSFSGDALSWVAGHSSTSSTFGYPREVTMRDRLPIAAASLSSSSPATATAANNSNNNNTTTTTTASAARSLYSPIPAGFERRKITVELEPHPFPSLLGELDPPAQVDGAGDSRHSGSGLHASPISVRTVFSDSLGAPSRDEGASTSSSGVSATHRCRTAGKWRHNPYDNTILRVSV